MDVVGGRDEGQIGMHTYPRRTTGNEYRRWRRGVSMAIGVLVALVALFGHVPPSSSAVSGMLPVVSVSSHVVDPLNAKVTIASPSCMRGQCVFSSALLPSCLAERRRPLVIAAAFLHLRADGRVSTPPCHPPTITNAN